MGPVVRPTGGSLMAQAPAEAPQPNKPGDAPNGGGRGRALAHGGFWTLVIGSIGVVYGDIGTSPLYAFKESFSHLLLHGEGQIAAEEVLGIVSLIFWALMIVVTL